MLTVYVPENVAPPVQGKLGTSRCENIGVGAVCNATSVHTSGDRSLVVALSVVAQVGADPPEVPAVVHRWILPLESTIRLPTL